jgi:hypothetical protein
MYLCFGFACVSVMRIIHIFSSRNQMQDLKVDVYGVSIHAYSHRVHVQINVHINIHINIHIHCRLSSK